ncbi:MAG: hypothetical protein ACTS80_00745 [Candidatus Hodgkinia cicadicola]
MVKTFLLTINSNVMFYPSVNKINWNLFTFNPLVRGGACALQLSRLPSERVSCKQPPAEASAELV